MDYTLSNSYVTDPASGHRMHEAEQAVPTAWSDLDANSIIWSLMAVVSAAGLAGAQFDPAVPATYTKLLTALRSAGVFQTAAQFDSSTRVATMAALQQAGLSYSDYPSPGANITLTAAYAGAVVGLAGSGNFTAQLPRITAFPKGKTIGFHHVGGGTWTVATQSTDVLYMGASATALSVAMSPGDTLFLVSDGNNWRAVGGSAQLAYSNTFASTTGPNAYQRSPGGGLECRGTFVSSGTPGAPVSVTFPLAFVSCDEVVITPDTASTSVASAWFDSKSTTGFNGHCNLAGVTCSYIAKGK